MQDDAQEARVTARRVANGRKARHGRAGRARCATRSHGGAATTPRVRRREAGSPWRAWIWVVVALLSLTGAGCGGRAVSGLGPDAVFIVPGAGGDGPWQDGLIRGLRQAGNGDQVHVVSWGAPLPLFFMNLETSSIHREAETELAQRLAGWRRRYPQAGICLIGHSAGCGVILGALGQSDESMQVQRVLLLAPSVSPGYDLGPALRHVQGRMHVFYSHHDTFWLGWRTGSFGTYDHARTKAAGNEGFKDLDRLPADLRDKIVQHTYDPAWEAWGNDGGHFGTLAPDFARRVLGPLLAESPAEHAIVR